MLLSKAEVATLFGVLSHDTLDPFRFEKAFAKPDHFKVGARAAGGFFPSPLILVQALCAVALLVQDSMLTLHVRGWRVVQGVGVRVTVARV